MSEENKATSGTGDQIDYKAELEKMKSENESLKKSNEDMRLEFMGDDYLNFLETKQKATQTTTTKDETKTTTTAGDDLLDKLTPKQAYELAKKEAAELASKEVQKFKEELANESKQKTANDVKKFFSNNPDAEKYRPVMYGLSTDPKHSNSDLDELYKLAKSHVKSLQEGATEEEKKRSQKSQGEKPGFSTSSFKPGDKKLSALEAGEKAWEETAAKSGFF